MEASSLLSLLFNAENIGWVKMKKDVKKDRKF